MNTESLETLYLVLEFLDGQADIVDGPEGEMPNRAMGLAQRVRDVIYAQTGELA